MKLYLIITLVCFAVLVGCKSKKEFLEVEKWSLLELSFEGSELEESSSDNPFLNYRLDVEFSKGDKKYIVPGFFAADGNAAETSAKKGNVWKVRFTPDETGDWTFKVNFRKGENIAVADDPSSGKSVFFDGQVGNIKVIRSNWEKPDFRAKGRLQYVGERYLQWEETGEFFLKGGTDSPENFLAFADFDSTYKITDSLESVKTYSEHLKDWNEGDPIWKNDKGKGIIGALNYLSSKGMNSVYFLTMNINGDGKDVWPYVSPNDFSRFDCSKLDQWDIVFSHMERKGLMLHVLTQETENEMLLDGGDLGLYRKLYYRELIARFGYHLAITWNLGEENGINAGNKSGQSDEQRKAMSTYFKENDPYQHPVVVHTWSREEDREKIYTPLLGFEDLDGPSLQVGNLYKVHNSTKKWINRSAKSGKQWFVCLDENGNADTGAKPDKDDPNHDTVRTHVLWGNLMAGGAGVEWYFGYKFVHSDLSCQDWRTRDLLWDQTKIALDFFHENLAFHEMESHDELVEGDKAWCFANPGKTYLIYKWGDNDFGIDLSGADGEFLLRYFNPKTGVLNDKSAKLIGDKKVQISTRHLGWGNSDVAILITKI